MTWNPYVIQILVFVGVSSALGLLFVLFSGYDRKLKKRLDDLDEDKTSALHLRRKWRQSNQSDQSDKTFLERVKNTLHRMGSGLLPKGNSERASLQLRLVRAGIYSPSAPSIMALTKMILMLVPPFLGTLIGVYVLDDMQKGLLGGSMVGALGMIMPNYWLNKKTKTRQSILRSSLPDFLDLIIVCLESGVSFESALQRVTDELRSAHPILTGELAVVQREIALGQATEDALQNFANRSDLDVVRTLASMVQQARKFGAGMSETLRIHSDTLREKRELRAEEMAQKAAVKVLFPTLLFIFPSIFVILIGPAAIDVAEVFSADQEETVERPESVRPAKPYSD
ncbi:MAG: type II secretion system F family protein [Planctomycetes bacterium]|nr:type II secretion system F family protein [Planctomycetota bacterium]